MLHWPHDLLFCLGHACSVPRSNKIVYTDTNKKAKLDNLNEQVTGPGRYKLIFKAPDSWVAEPLVWEFEVSMCGCWGNRCKLGHGVPVMRVGCSQCMCGPRP